MRKLLLSTLGICMLTPAFAQFPGAAGTLGSTAMYKDSSAFVAWAQTCSITRGYQDISNTALGFTTTGDSTFATGHADGIEVVSLGDGGSAILSFNPPITNGVGPDFAVFENGFINEFLELAFVEVSSDGQNFFRFKATSNTQTDVQMGPFDYNADATLLNNLAGKYRALYGTPFDLEELSGTPNLDINAITHIKIIDVVGSINPLYASYDQYNNAINDHFPTPFPQGGFDLDAIGVIHQQATGIEQVYENTLQAFPNPLQSQLYIRSNTTILNVVCYTSTGTMIPLPMVNLSNSYDTSHLLTGMYILIVTFKNGSMHTKKLIKQ